MIVNLFLTWITCISFISRNDLPTFKGGQRNLNSFITGSIIYPEYSKFNCLQGTIQVSFKLNKNGRIFSSKIEKGMGIDLDDEALRVVRLTSGKWIVPASFDTTQSLTLPINFSLKEYNCESRTGDEIREALAAYKAREDLTNAVTNYYRRKSAGNTDPDEEQKILELKEQLGFNDKFIDRLIRRGQQKLKQGDKESACEDFVFVKHLGSEKANKLLEINCTK